MRRIQIEIAFASFLAITASACGGAHTAPIPEQPPQAVKPAMPALVSSSENPTIRFLEKRIESDPDDFVAYHKLSTLYLQQLRETGDISYLQLAERAAKASLAIMPEGQNKGGLSALTRAEFSSHKFEKALEHGLRLAQIDPGKAYVYQILGDTYFELGRYDDAAKAYTEMEKNASRQDGASIGIEQRRAKMASLYGEDDKAKKHMQNSLRLAEKALVPSPETIAWCKWQLGEIAMSDGDYGGAERYFNSALQTFPGYFAANEALGHLRAARGDLKGAIEIYERSAGSTPDPASTAMLGDLYKLSGRESDAAGQYALFDEIARQDAAKGNLHSREILMFYANHDVKTAEACDAAQKDYEARKDIYGADLVAWTCFKAGRMDIARTAMSEAMRFGTKEALFFYHAGMIENSLGNKAEARRLLNLALKTNPSFDFLQAATARQVLAAGL
jgi:tetratricopeptide (TPR) repeat protein